MKLTRINNKWYISISKLRELGFNYPPKGTMGIYRKWFDDDSNWYKFHEKKEGWDGIWISPFLTDIGKRNISDGEFFIEFNPISFEYKNV